MDTQATTALPNHWEQQAHEYVIQGNYPKAAHLYQQAIEVEPNVKPYYWHLGLMLLLQEQEAEAQTTWLLAMAEGEPEEIDLWTAELIEVLQTEAERREAVADYSFAWAIRQHIREINPSDINNLLQLIRLAIELKTFTREDMASLGTIEALQSEDGEAVNPDLLLLVLHNALDYDPLDPSLLKFAEACLPHICDPQAFIRVLLIAAIKINYTALQPEMAARLAELCLRLEAENSQVYYCLANCYQNAANYEEGIKAAKLSYSYSQNLPDKIFANYMILRGLMSAGGYWQEAVATFDHHKSLLLSLVEEKTTSLDQVSAVRLLTATFFAPYFEDNPQPNKSIQNQVAQLCQLSIQKDLSEQAKRYRQRLSPSRRLSTPEKPLRIGYLSHSFGRHSVGWLARWIFQYHDQERFDINAYFINYKQTADPLQQWYFERIPKLYKFGLDALEIAEKIYRDEIDVLVDLDSITLDAPGKVLSLKPAPIQVTWLGWDASGLPGIDHFIADPYVLPESAQDYYTEKIWQLPQTYIAVDGFEVGIPTLRRDRLAIPSDAVVYLSAQTAYKRHLDTARLQMKILKEVPNSYFLIKGLGNQKSLKNFFIQIAEEEDVDSARLRFLPEVLLEDTHRANLGIADVVLDTYPYNGATTTLETLWMGVPLVTRVGQQFAARNSYAMMMNVGVTEGIAWTDEEYVEWGIHLGKNPALRQKIAWQLRQSRQTSPLWNAKQFTREMEKAYEQMWENYLRREPQVLK